jgi:hypothetical protein
MSKIKTGFKTVKAKVESVVMPLLGYEQITIGHQAQTKTPIQVMYVKLNHIFEGDMKLEEGKYIHVFLFQCEDLDGKEYICPVHVEQGYFVHVRNALNRMQPIHMLFDVNPNGDVSLKDNVEVKIEGNCKVVDISSVKVNKEGK